MADIRITGSSPEIEKILKALQSAGFKFSGGDRLYPRRNEDDQFSAYLNNIEPPSTNTN